MSRNLHTFFQETLSTAPPSAKFCTWRTWDNNCHPWFRTGEVFLRGDETIESLLLRLLDSNRSYKGMDQSNVARYRFGYFFEPVDCLGCGKRFSGLTRRINLTDSKISSCPSLTSQDLLFSLDNSHMNDRYHRHIHHRLADVMTVLGESVCAIYWGLRLKTTAHTTFTRRRGHIPQSLVAVLCRRTLKCGRCRFKESPLHSCKF